MPDIVEGVFDVHEQHDCGDDERDEADRSEAELIGAREAVREEIRDHIAGNRDDEFVDSLDELRDVRLFVECDDEAGAHDEERDEREHRRVCAACDAREQSHVLDFDDEQVDEAEDGIKAARGFRLVFEAVQIVLAAFLRDFIDQF